MGLVLLLPAASSAQTTYDLAGDWSDVANPNGPWSYDDAAGLPLATHQANWAPESGCCQPAWSNAVSPLLGHVPMWFRRTANSSLDVDVPEGFVGLHGTPLSSPGWVGVSWTATISSTVAIRGAVWAAEMRCGAPWRLRHGQDVIASGSVDCASSSASPLDISSGVASSGALSRTVTAGDVVELDFFDAAAFVGVALSIDAGPALPPRIATTSLPALHLNEPNDVAVSVRHGVPPYRWSIVAGTLLPGVSLDVSSGRFFGVPSTPGLARARLRVTDSAGTTDEADVRLEAKARDSWSLTHDWSDSSNPNGPWSYESPTGTPIARPLDDWDPADCCFDAPQPAWATAPWPELNHEQVWFKIAAPSTLVDLPIGRVGSHGNGGGFGATGIRWVSPVTGSILIDGHTWMGLKRGRRMDWALSHNALHLASGSLTSTDTFTSDAPMPLTTGGALQRSVRTGDELLLDFGTPPAANAEFLGAELRIRLAAPPTASALHPSHGAALGAVTVSVTGSDLSPNTRLTLTRSGSAPIVGTHVTSTGPNEITTTLDLTQAALGAWDVVLERTGRATSTLVRGFTVVEPEPTDYEVTLVGPTSVRAGRPRKYWVAVDNPSAQDLYQVGVLLESSNASLDSTAPLAWQGDPDHAVGRAGELTFLVDHVPAASTVFVPFEVVSTDDDDVEIEGRAFALRSTPVRPGRQTSSVMAPDIPPPGTLVFQSPPPSLSDPASLLGTGHVGVVWYGAIGNEPPAYYVWENLVDGGTRLTPWVDFRNRSYPDYPDTSRGWQGYVEVPMTDAQRAALHDWLLDHSSSGDNPLSYSFTMKCTDAVHLGFESIGITLIPGNPHTVGDPPWLDWHMLSTEPWGGANQAAWYSMLPRDQRDAFIDWVTRTIDAARLGFKDLLLTLRKVNSQDPNAKYGAAGAGDERYVQEGAPLHYLITFENLVTATAPAQEVEIADALDPTALDLETLTLGPITFGDHIVVPGAGQSELDTTVDLRPEQDLVVHVNAYLDEDLGVLRWKLTALDPLTLELPDDPAAGFLPPNTNPPLGEGSVSFRVLPLPGLETGYGIENDASIVFDTNEPIVTGVWSNRIDRSPPQSSVRALAPTRSEPRFDVEWRGSDLGSGIATYTVYVAEDGGAFQVWLEGTQETSATFEGRVSARYAFFSEATDLAGNREPSTGAFDAETEVVAPAEDASTPSDAGSEPTPARDGGPSAPTEEGCSCRAKRTERRGPAGVLLTSAFAWCVFRRRDKAIKRARR